MWILHFCASISSAIKMGTLTSMFGKTASEKIDCYQDIQCTHRDQSFKEKTEFPYKSQLCIYKNHCFKMDEWKKKPALVKLGLHQELFAERCSKEDWVADLISAQCHRLKAVGCIHAAIDQQSNNMHLYREPSLEMESRARVGMFTLRWWSCWNLLTFNSFFRFCLFPKLLC